MPLLSDSFGLIRVINLPDRTDRYREVSQQIEALGLKFATGTVEIFPARRVTALAGFPSLGARGCFLSHLEVLRDARTRGVGSVMVMEDDCEVPTQAVSALARIAEELRGRTWAFVYFGHIVPLSELAVGAEPRLVEYTGPVQNTHLYAVHASVLAPLIEYLEGCTVRPPGDPVGGPMNVDGALSMFRAAHPEAVTLLTQPSLAYQRSSRSDVTSRSYELVPGIKQALTVARKLKQTIRRIRR